MQYNVLEARNNLSRLIDSALSGEDVVLAKRGKPVARIVKIEEDRPPHGTGAALAKIMASWDPLPPRSNEEIEAEIREAKSGWKDER